ncbi:SPOR domain-containing protein [Ruegeria arenilitoris]|uniref:SPOR domain-containing protein n=1 Tax=Ruegeria arenilitoris TaxID=1173585 RepID=UPI001C2C4027|nr:SPOR domain-containing protein [Ruegeria arenilitoris]
MKRATETRAKTRSVAVLAVALAALAGCEEGLSPDKAPEDAQSGDTQADDKVELFPDYTDNSGDSVEAPDAFNVVEAGLWDGRPSLGGIWVAHPDVTQPERVVIKNTTNNKTITGALFRRERNLPGPALQLSSAAAEKLGILAGAPTKVEVTALRRKPVEEKEPEETGEVETADNAPSDDNAKSQDTAANASVDGEEKPVKRKWWQKKETVAAAGVATAATAATADTATEAAEETVAATPQATTSPSLSDAEVTQPKEKPAKRKWWQKKEPVAAAGVTGAAVAATSDATTEATAEAAEEVVESTTLTTPSPTLSDPEVAPPKEKPAKRKWWQKKDPDAITETPLEPVAGATAAIDAADPTPVVATAAASQEKAPRSLTKPYVQVGTFNVQANAKSAVSKIERNGMAADIRELNTGDKTVWRVLVGPAATRSERKAIQSDVKDLGFTDAFTVKN